MTSISNKTNQDVYAAFNKLGHDAASNDAKMSSQVKEETTALVESMVADAELSPVDKKNLVQQAAALLPMAGEAGYGAEWNADMQKLVTQLATLQKTTADSHATGADKASVSVAPRADSTTNQQVFDAYNALNTLAAANLPSNSAKIQQASQTLLSMVRNDATLTTTQQQDLEARLTGLLQIAGKPGNGAAWNTQMQGLVDELYQIADGNASSNGATQADASSGSVKARDTNDDALTNGADNAPVKGTATYTGAASATNVSDTPKVSEAISSAGTTNRANNAAKSIDTAQATGANSSVPALPATAALSDTTLYPSGNGPSIQDIQQGRLNDCTIDAALSSMVSNNASTIADMFRKNADNTYAVTLFPAGKKTTVDIDPSKDLVSQGTTGSDGKTDWASMIEAAALKVGFSLNNGNGAQPGDAMQLLTGTGGMAGDTSDFGDLDNLQTSLQTELASGKIVIAGTPTASVVNGITIDADHAYAVLKVVDGQVTLRNPWANQVNNGLVTMSLADYAKAFPWTYMQD